VPSKRGNGSRTSRRPSLRTYLDDRVRSSKRRARAGSSAKPSASGTRRTRVGKRPSSLAPRTVVVGTLCLVAAAALVMSRNSSVVNWVAEVDGSGNVQRLERVDNFDPAQMTTASDAPVSSHPLPRTTSLTSTTELEPKRAEPASAPYQFAPVPAAPAEPTPRMVTASLRSTEAEPEPASAPPANEQAEAAVPATIVGCLERDADTFWLKNVSGADAPKSRSWKSGFLRKKSSNVALVDRAGLSNRLSTYVGRRIETTGALTEREMHVKTLRVLGACE
jgi:hypothetical protein